MNTEQTSRHEKIFDLFSQSQSRTVEVSELEKLLLLGGHTVTPAHVKELVCAIGKDRITLDEFLEISTNLGKVDIVKEDLRKAFQALDPSNSGNVALQELVGILREGESQLSASEIEELVEMLEPDSNGMVNYGAFIKSLYDQTSSDS